MTLDKEVRERLERALVSPMAHIASGTVGIAPSDLRALLSAYDENKDRVEHRSPEGTRSALAASARVVEAACAYQDWLKTFGMVITPREYQPEELKAAVDAYRAALATAPEEK